MGVTRVKASTISNMLFLQAGYPAFHIILIVQKADNLSGFEKEFEINSLYTSTQLCAAARDAKTPQEYPTGHSFRPPGQIN